MNLRYQFTLARLVMLGLLALTACEAKPAPPSQPAENLPVHPNMTLVPHAPTEMARTVVNLEDWLRCVCPGRWSYYVTSDRSDVVMEWYAAQLRREGWSNAVEEEKRLPKEARLPTWGVWHGYDKDQEKVVVLIAEPITLPVSTGDLPAKKAYVAVRACAVSTSP